MKPINPILTASNIHLMEKKSHMLQILFNYERLPFSAEMLFI